MSCASSLRGTKQFVVYNVTWLQTITFTLYPSDLASFDAKTTSWLAEKGSYTVKVGASSLDIKQTASFNLANDVVVEKDHNVLQPKTNIDEMKN